MQFEKKKPNPPHTGPNITQANISSLIKGKPWIVFIHGGDFVWYDGKDANYAETNSKVAAAAGMGVLAIDYRSLARVPVPALYPEPIEDVVAGERKAA